METSMTLEEFGASIKAKYPEYSQYSDSEIGQKMLVKFPQYKSKVTVPEPEAQKPGLIGGIKNAFSNRVNNAADAQEATVQGKQGLLSGTLQTLGQGAAFVGDVAMEGLKAVTPDFVEDAASSALQSALQPIAKTKAAQGISEWAKQHPEAASNLEAVFNVAGIVPAGAVAGTGLKATGAAAKTAGEALGNTGRATLKFGGEIISPSPTPANAVGQVLQGTTKDIRSGIEAIKNIDIKGVKTYGDLKQRMTDKIPDLARVVDEELAKDPAKLSLDDLAVKSKTKSGKEVASYYVDDSLSHLRELYSSIGDNVKIAEIDELAEVAGREGLTRQEVNDISRIYGQEFGSKAFNKVGDPLTSVNAQKFENVRKGLKTIARSGISGEAAKSADRAMTALYNTERLVEKNVQAVNKLQQRISERGLLEKAGYGLAKVTDTLSGGTIRGIVAGILPRGAGYKVLNALDLEEKLAKNLKVIQDAIDSGKDADLIKAVQSLAK